MRITWATAWAKAINWSRRAGWRTNGFFDESVALHVLQGGPTGLISSTVVDFRLGRLLGVAFIGTIGDHQRPELTMQIGQALEKRMAAVVLGV